MEPPFAGESVNSSKRCAEIHLLARLLRRAVSCRERLLQQPGLPCLDIFGAVFPFNPSSKEFLPCIVPFLLLLPPPSSALARRLRRMPSNRASSTSTSATYAPTSPRTSTSTRVRS